jgi:hypothetical protein
VIGMPGTCERCLRVAMVLRVPVPLDSAVVWSADTAVPLDPVSARVSLLCRPCYAATGTKEEADLFFIGMKFSELIDAIQRGKVRRPR